MARKTIEYQPGDAKLRGADLKKHADDLAVDFLARTGLDGMFDRMTPPFPASVELLSSWVDDATDGLYSTLRRKVRAYAKFYERPFGGGDLRLVLEDPTSGSLLFGAMRRSTVQVSLAGRLPPPVPASAPIPVPPSWVGDQAVLGWVRTVLRARADRERLLAVLARVVARTRLRPWTTLAAFSPAFAGYYGHAFRPTTDLWRAMPEPDIAFVEKLVPNLLLHARHPAVEGQSVIVRLARGSAP